jgi:group II intron reverse transcriptase/maturase
MRTAEQVLGIIRERGKAGKPLEDIYRQLFNQDLFLRAYARLSGNSGAMTPGVTAETVDGMSLAKIETIITALRYERYQWTPVRRTHIPKKNGKSRPLGIPTWSDKLVQEVIRLILEAYYDPQFSPHSHGFRPAHGCHTALGEVITEWTGTKWFIEGDIRGCFDNIDHQVLLAILAEKLHDNRFLRLIRNLLATGYLENWTYGKTLSGTPQGGVVSPILSNIYLDRLDQYVAQVLQPTHNKGALRKRHHRWHALAQGARYHQAQGHHETARTLRKELQKLPSQDPNDPDYRRLRYVRYADDFLIGFVGPRAEAEVLKDQLATFLRQELKLELSPEKTLITHAQTEAARFLGYEIGNQQANDKHDQTGRRSLNGRIGLRVPIDVIRQRCALYEKHGRPTTRNGMLYDADYSIVGYYQSEFRGVVQYYALAQNVSWFWRLHWTMQTSLLRTLAGKHKSTLRQMLRKYQTTVETPHGPMKCLQVNVERENKPPLVARFGGIPLRRQHQAVLADTAPSMRIPRHNELLKRLLADTCEICGGTENCQVHHVHKLADLNNKGRKAKPAWMHIMAARRRKTLVLCHACHVGLHAGRPLKQVSN